MWLNSQTSLMDLHEHIWKKGYTSFLENAIASFFLKMSP